MWTLLNRITSSLYSLIGQLEEDDELVMLLSKCIPRPDLGSCVIVIEWGLDICMFCLPLYVDRGLDICLFCLPLYVDRGLDICLVCLPLYVDRGLDNDHGLMSGITAYHFT
ncbi:hypothetical protein Btru_054531 [Bulinus truncatus]|nr:hypothetical protein Btru_054531 [Bulinus truncatus]